ncbi:hypothetical protein KAU15_04680, partial [candidate division WOR-3 bacterium]|nr:hypothetical protein [candidate division WOR-3 bacterium]
NCYRYTTLPPGINKKTMFNFTYYLEDCGSGVFSISNESVDVGYKTFTYFDLGGMEVSETIIFPPFAKHPVFQYDSIVKMPRYIHSLIKESYRYNCRSYDGYKLNPQSSSYIESWKNNRYGEQLSIFIDKVLASTGASKVNLVCHSIGGVVARSAIIGYGDSLKVNKLITLGTPHKPIEAGAAEWWALRPLFWDPSPYWQKNGELKELSVDIEIFEVIKFVDLVTGEKNDFANFLGYNVSPVKMVCVSGNRNAIAGIPYTSRPNDGFIFNNISQLGNYALCNPVIFASHSLGPTFDNESFPELGLLTCTYTTELIKNWIIDGIDDMLSPNISMILPEQNFITNGFTQSSDILHIEFDTEDMNYVDSINISIRNSSNELIAGNIDNFLKISPDEVVEIINNSIIRRPGISEVKTSYDFTFIDIPLEDRYNINIVSKDDLGNIGTHKQYFYIDRTPPVITSETIDDILRVSQQLDNEFYVMLNIEDNFGYMFSRLKTLEWKYKKEGAFINSDFSDYNYLGHLLHSFPLENYYEDGLYEISIRAEDYAGNDVEEIIKYVELDGTPPNIAFTPDLPSVFEFTLANESYDITYTTNEFTEGYIFIVNNENSFTLYDEGNINDEDYVRGDTDELLYVLNSEKTSHYPDGEYTIKFKYMDELGNAAVYAEIPMIIDRTAPRIKQAIAEPFVCVNGDELKVSFIISEEDDNDNNTGEMICSIYKNENLLESDIVTLINDTITINYLYIIPENENGRQNLKIVVKDQNGNTNSTYVNYIVNTLGVLITQPEEESILDKGIYAIKGIASDPNITNSYKFKEFKVQYLFGVSLKNDNIWVPSHLMGSDVNISKYPVNYEDILGYIDLRSIYDNATVPESGEYDIGIVVTAYEEVTGKCIADTNYITINDIESMSFPTIQSFIFEYEEDPATISYNIINKSSEIDLAIINSNNELVYRFDAENYYCFEENISMSDNDKVYVYKDELGNYYIESTENVNNVSVTLSDVNIVNVFETIYEGDGKYIFNGIGIITFVPTDVINETAIISSPDYNKFIVGENIVSQDKIMKFGGIKELTYNYIDGMGNTIDPGNYRVILEATGFNNGFDSDTEEFERNSNLSIIADASPNEINPYEPGFETSIINISGTESFTLNMSLISPDDDVIQIVNESLINRQDIYRYEFDGYNGEEIIFGEWQVDVEAVSIDNSITIDESITIDVIDEEINVYGYGLTIPNEYIRGELDSRDVINAEPIFGFDFKPNGLAKLPIPYELNFYTHGRKYIENLSLANTQYVEEIQKDIGSYNSMIIDSSRPIDLQFYTNVIDHNIIGKIIIKKKPGTKIKVYVSLFANKYCEIYGVPYEWHYKLKYKTNSREIVLAEGIEDAHSGLGNTDNFEFTIDENTDRVEI